MSDTNNLPAVDPRSLVVQKAGMEIGDTILSVDGIKIDSWERLARTIHKRPEKKIPITFKRGDAVFSKELVPRKDDASGRGMIGIMPKIFYKKVGFLFSVKEGAMQCYRLTAFTITTIASKISKAESPDLAGPVGIVQMVSRAAHSGIEDLIFLIGLISVAIGFFNILPIPLLDGGHAAFYIWEGLSGKKLTPRAMAAANGVGICFLLSLLVFATFNDFSRILSQRKAREKVEVTAPEPVKDAK